MFPRYFPYGQPGSVPSLNNLLGLGLGVPIDTTPVGPTQDFSSLLFSSQAGISNVAQVQAIASQLYPFQSNQIFTSLPITNPINPLINHQISLSHMLHCLNPALQQQIQQPQSSEVPTSVTANADAHTIVRGPVLYGNSSTTNNVSQSSIESTKASPPDQVVASYAAAAIAGRQAPSNASEVFLNIAASAASTLASLNGTGVTTAKNRPRRTSLGGYSAPTSVAVVGPLNTAPATSTTRESNKPPLPWNSTWTRIVDRQADVVVYISPGGSRLKSVTDVRAYLERFLPAEKASAISDDCINTSFCFDATKESRCISAPDDSIFVFSEDSSIKANVSGVLGAVENAEIRRNGEEMQQSPAPPHPANSAQPVTPSSQPLAATSTDMGTPVSISTASNTPALPNEDENIVASTKTKDESAVEKLKRSAPETESKNVANGAEFSEEKKAQDSIETEVDGGSTEPPAKLQKTESEPQSSKTQTSQSHPSLNDVAQTSFVARSMARAGGPTTVIPSVVPSIIPPTTLTPTVPNLTMLQYLGSLQQQHNQHAFLASAALMNPVFDQNLMEQLKMQQMAALFLQQQQHLQAVYANAFNQQQNLQGLQPPKQQQNSNSEQSGSGQ